MVVSLVYFLKRFSTNVVKEVSLYICSRSIKWHEAGVNIIVSIHTPGRLVTF